jgi:hypothetical protein
MREGRLSQCRMSVFDWPSSETSSTQGRGRQLGDQRDQPGRGAGVLVRRARPVLHPARRHQVPAGAARWRRVRRCPHPDPAHRRRRVHQPPGRWGLRLDLQQLHAVWSVGGDGVVRQLRAGRLLVSVVSWLKRQGTRLRTPAQRRASRCEARERADSQRFSRR